MKEFDVMQWFRRFGGWQGWKKTGRFFVKGWQAAVGWKGWPKLFAIPLWALLLLSAVCAAALIWVFTHGLEQWIPVYFLYVLSAYLLAALCIKLPSGVRRGKTWLQSHPRIADRLADEEFKFTLGLYFEQFINFAYGIFKIISGIVIGSAWIGSDGIYNFTQALIQLFQILRRKNPGSIRKQWQSYRFCGVLVLLMHLTLTGIVFQMVNWNRAEEHAGYMIFATAAFAFYKIISSFVHVAKDRKHLHPIDSSVRMMELSQAIFAIFSLQASMLHSFGTGEVWEGRLNAATGCAVCLLVAAMGVYMIHRGNREIKTLQEKENG